MSAICSLSDLGIFFYELELSLKALVFANQKESVIAQTILYKNTVKISVLREVYYM